MIINKINIKNVLILILLEIVLPINSLKMIIIY